MRALATAALAIGMGLSFSASAETYAGSGEIIRGDYAAAERLLAAERRLSPDNAEVMLNLAVVYAQTGRSGAARGLYQDVLARPDEELTLANGAFVSSHDLAGEALQRLGDPALASR